MCESSKKIADADSFSVWNDGRIWWRYLVAIVPLLVMLSYVYLRWGDDVEVFSFFKAYREAHPGMTQVMQIFTEYSNMAFYLIYLIILAIGLKKHSAKKVALVAAYLISQFVVALCLCQIFKLSFGRSRPRIEAESWEPFSGKGFNSFPSGHSTEYFGASMVFLYVKSFALSLLLGLSGAMMGFSRIYLGAHHPSDVLAGALLGSFGALVTLCIWSKITPRLKTLPIVKKWFAGDRQ